MFVSHMRLCIVHVYVHVVKVSCVSQLWEWYIIEHLPYYSGKFSWTQTLVFFHGRRWVNEYLIPQNGFQKGQARY